MDCEPVPSAYGRYDGGNWPYPAVEKYFTLGQIFQNSSQFRFARRRRHRSRRWLREMPGGLVEPQREVGTRCWSDSSSDDPHIVMSLLGASAAKAER